MAGKNRFGGIFNRIGFGGDSAEVTAHNDAVAAFCESLGMGTDVVLASPTRENLEEMIKLFNDSSEKVSAYLSDPRTNAENKDRLDAVQRELTEYYHTMNNVGGTDGSKLYSLKVFLEAAEAGPPATQSHAKRTQWFENYRDLAESKRVKYKKDFPDLLSEEDEKRLETFERQFAEVYEVLSVDIGKVEAGMSALREMDDSNLDEVVAAIKKLQKNIGALNNPQLEPPLTAENRSYLDAAKAELMQRLQAAQPSIQPARILDFTEDFEALKAEVKEGVPPTLNISRVHPWIDEKRAAIDSLLSKTALRDKWPELEDLKFNHLLKEQSKFGPPSDLNSVDRLQWIDDRLEEVAGLSESTDVRKMTAKFTEERRLAQLRVASEDDSFSKSESQQRDEVSTQQHVQPPPPPPQAITAGPPGINFADLMRAQQSREDRVPEEGVEVAKRTDTEHSDEKVDGQTDAEKLQEAVTRTLGNLKKRDASAPGPRQNPTEEVQETLSPLEQMRARNAAKKQQQGTENTSGTESPTSVAGGRNTPEQEQEPEKPAWMKNLKRTNRVEQPTSTEAPQIPEWQRKQQEKLKAQTDALRRDGEGPTQEEGHGNENANP